MDQNRVVSANGADAVASVTVQEHGSNIRVVNITLIHDKKYCKNLVLERCPAGGCGNDAPERSVSQGALWRSRDRHSANFLPGYFWGMGSIFGLMDRLGRVRGRVRRRAGERHQV